MHECTGSTCHVSCATLDSSQTVYHSGYKACGAPRGRLPIGRGLTTCPTPEGSVVMKTAKLVLALAASLSGTAAFAAPCEGLGALASPNTAITLAQSVPAGEFGGG